MHPLTLDHVALYVRDRDRTTRLLVDEVGLRVIDHTDKYTLIGPSATDGKLTLFEAPDGYGAPEAGRLVSVTLADASATPRSALELDEGFSVQFGMSELAAADVAHGSLIGVTLRSDDPAATARAYQQSFGFTAATTGSADARVAVGGGFVDLRGEQAAATSSPALFHLGVLVASAQHHIDEAGRTGIDVVNVVDAPNTYAVFLAGPEGTCVEYVEHKQSFALS